MNYIDMVDTVILILLIIWAFMDRFNLYFRKDK